MNSPSPLSKYLTAINQTKENLVTEDTTDYNCYVITHCLMTQDTILLANEMNKHPELPPVVVNKYYLSAITKGKRFTPWLKPTTISDLELIKHVYKYNTSKAKQALQILSEIQISKLREKYTDKNI